MKTKKSFNPYTGEIRITSKPHEVYPGWLDWKHYEEWVNTPGTIKNND